MAPPLRAAAPAEGHAPPGVRPLDERALRYDRPLPAQGAEPDDDAVEVIRGTERSAEGESAQDLYSRAYITKQTDPAAACRMFRRVLELARHDDVVRAKAKNWTEVLACP